MHPFSRKRHGKIGQPPIGYLYVYICFDGTNVADDGLCIFLSLFIMDRYVEAPAFVPSTASTHDTAATSSEASDILYSEALQSPLRHGKLRVGCSSPRGGMNTKMKQKDGWSAFTSSNSFEHLYTEKAYLTASLENQGDREVGLMRKLSLLQEKIDNGLPYDERRRSKRKAALLKSRIMEVAEQKKAILLRLGDIYVELQSRETWMHIQSELYEQRCPPWWSTDPPSVGFVTTPSDITSMMPTPLDAASPTFFTTSYHPLHGPWETVPSHSESQVHAPPGGVQAEFWTKGSNGFGIRAGELGNQGLQFEYEDQALAPGVNGERYQFPSWDDSLQSINRRMSLPSLKCIWPGSEESRGLQEHASGPLGF
ncbi:hypothetical protein LX36DRAFT_680601 [Colletotrichum falcatum]|nr:hypothetical protein LX36DRAFT_680601 [Colletotrichum falcatum]